MKSLLRALRYFRPDAPRISGVALLLFLSTLASLLKPWPLALIVDSVLGQRPLPAFFAHHFDGWSKSQLLTALAGATLLLHLAQGFLSAAQNYGGIAIGLHGLRRVRDEVFERLERLSLRSCQGTQTGDLIHRASWDTYSFQTLFQQGLITFGSALLSLALMVVIMWRLNSTLTLAALGTVPLVLVSIRFFGGKMRDRGTQAQQADSRITSTIQQTIATLPLIQSYTREAQEAAAFTAQTTTACNRRLAQHGWELLYWLAISLAFSLGTATIVWLGGRQVQDGFLTIGELLIFLAYLTQLYDPLNQLSHVGATVANAGAGAQRVFELLDRPDEITDRPAAIGLATPAPGGIPRGALEFDHVSFAYQPGQPVLRGLCFAVAAGESIAIIGPSGVGKSTLLNLLPRFFDPTAGSVRLDGKDLRDLRLHDLRQNIAVVPQEPVLLAATVAENIAYGKPGATTAEIETAARAAHAHDFILNLPQGYETAVGEGAARLSVGQKQRLNLARAFLKDAPILLLDEPTSALDTESEALVVASLEQLMRGRTTFIVAHRLTTIRRASKVLVLEAGRIAQFGPLPDSLGFSPP